MRIKTIALLIPALLAGCHHSDFKDQDGAVHGKMVRVDGVSLGVVGESGTRKITSELKIENATIADYKLSYKSISDSDLNGVFGDVGDLVTIGDEIKEKGVDIPVSVSLDVIDVATGKVAATKTEVLNGGRVMTVSSFPSSRNGEEFRHRSLVIKYDGSVLMTTDHSIGSPDKVSVIGSIGDTSNGVVATIDDHLSIINTGIGVYFVDGDSKTKHVEKAPITTSHDNLITDVKVRRSGDMIVIAALLKDGNVNVCVKKGDSFKTTTTPFIKKTNISKFFFVDNPKSDLSPVRMIAQTATGGVTDVYIDSTGAVAVGDISGSNIKTTLQFGNYIYALKDDGSLLKGGVLDPTLSLDSNYSNISGIFSNKDTFVLLSKDKTLHSVDGNGADINTSKGVNNVFKDGDHGFLIDSTNGYYFYGREWDIIKDSNGDVLTGLDSVRNTSFSGFYHFKNGSYLFDSTKSRLLDNTSLTFSDGQLVEGDETTTMGGISGYPTISQDGIDVINNANVSIGDMGVVIEPKSADTMRVFLLPPLEGLELDEKTASMSENVSVLLNQSKSGTDRDDRIFITGSDIFVVDNNDNGVYQTPLSLGSDGGGVATLLATDSLHTVITSHNNHDMFVSRGDTDSGTTGDSAPALGSVYDGFGGSAESGGIKNLRGYNKIGNPSPSITIGDGSSTAWGSVFTNKPNTANDGEYIKMNSSVCGDSSAYGAIPCKSRMGVMGNLTWQPIIDYGNPSIYKYYPDIYPSRHLENSGAWLIDQHGQGEITSKIDEDMQNRYDSGLIGNYDIPKGASVADNFLTLSNSNLSGDDYGHYVVGGNADMVKKFKTAVGGESFIVRWAENRNVYVGSPYLVAKTGNSIFSGMLAYIEPRSDDERNLGNVVGLVAPDFKDHSKTNTWFALVAPDEEHTVWTAEERTMEMLINPDAYRGDGVAYDGARFIYFRSNGSEKPQITYISREHGVGYKPKLKYVDDFITNTNTKSDDWDGDDVNDPIYAQRAFMMRIYKTPRTIINNDLTDADKEHELMVGLEIMGKMVIQCFSSTTGKKVECYDRYKRATVGGTYITQLSSSGVAPYKLKDGRVMGVANKEMLVGDYSVIGNYKTDAYPNRDDDIVNEKIAAITATAESVTVRPFDSGWLVTGDEDHKSVATDGTDLGRNILDDNDPVVGTYDLTEDISSGR